MKTLPALSTHQKGEQSTTPEGANNYPETMRLSVDTFGGRVHVEWDPQSAVTPLGQLPFFIEFLKLGNLFNPWVEDCPLSSISPNAPSKKDILGTLLLHAVAKQTSHAGQTHLKITSTHGRADRVRQVLSRITDFFESLKNCAEQFTSEQLWYKILSKALEKFLGGKILKPLLVLAESG